MKIIIQKIQIIENSFWLYKHILCTLNNPFINMINKSLDTELSKDYIL